MQGGRDANPAVQGKIVGKSRAARCRSRYATTTKHGCWSGWSSSSSASRSRPRCWGNPRPRPTPGLPVARPDERERPSQGHLVLSARWQMVSTARSAQLPRAAETLGRQPTQYRRSPPKAVLVGPINYSRVERDHTGDDVWSVGKEHYAAQKTRKVSYYLSLLIHEYDRLHSYNMLSHLVLNL